MSRPRQPQVSGLTLVEFLFATSLMAMVGLGVAGMFPSALRSVVGGGRVTKAANLAQEMINMIRNEPFDNLYLAPSSGNCFRGYSNFDTRNVLSASCASGTGSPDSLDNKRKWKADLLADTAQSSGQGLPGGYGTVAVTCLSASASSPYTLTATTCSASTNIVRVSVTVRWTGGGSQVMNLDTYVARSE